MNSKRSKKRKDLHNYDTTLTWINSIALYGSHMSGCLDIAQFQIFFRSIYIYMKDSGKGSLHRTKHFVKLKFMSRHFLGKKWNRHFQRWRHLLLVFCLTICTWYRVLKLWRHKNEISEIMGFVRIFWKNNVQEAYLPKMSISGQIVSEMLAGHTQKTPYKPL